MENEKKIMCPEERIVTNTGILEEFKQAIILSLFKKGDMTQQLSINKFIQHIYSSRRWILKTATD